MIQNVEDFEYDVSKQQSETKGLVGHFCNCKTSTSDVNCLSTLTSTRVAVTTGVTGVSPGEVVFSAYYINVCYLNIVYNKYECCNLNVVWRRKCLFPLGNGGNGSITFVS